MIVDGGRCNTARILSLLKIPSPTRQWSACPNAPDTLAQLGFIDTIPDAEDVLALTHANRTPTYLRPFVLVRRRDASELVADESEDEVLPDAIRDALAEAEDPFPAGKVEGVLPDGAADALVEEEVVRRREEGRGRMEVRPEGPEGLDRGKGGDLLDALFVVGDLVSRRALLAEPEDPSVGRASHHGVGRADSLDRVWQREEGRTYVLRRGCTDSVGSPAEDAAGLFSLTEVPFCSSESVVEKCLDGTRTGGGVAPESEELVVVVVTTVVDDESLSLSERKRD